jgi:hypothetical protein
MIAATEAAHEIQNINLKSQDKTMKTTLKNQAKLVTIALVCGFMLATAFPAPAQELTPVSEPPASGTFWLLSSKLNHQLSPPYPCDPYKGALPVYEMSGFPGQYVVGDSPEDYQRLQASGKSRAGRMNALDSEGIPFPGGGDEGTNGYSYTPPPDIPNHLKYQAQTFAVIDTNAAAVNDTNLYNTLASFSDDNGTNPVLQVLPYQGNCLLFKASHFDYSGETDRDFALVVCDKVETPLYKTVNLPDMSTNNGWLIQGLISKYKVTDPMYLVVSNISRIYNAFFQVIPYSGPTVQLSGAQDYDMVSNTIALQAAITDLSGVTNEQIEILVDGLPARYSLSSSDTINIDTRYAPNGIEPVSVLVGNSTALLYDPANSVTDNKLSYQSTATLSLDFENSIYLTFAGDESSPDVGTNYTEFTVSQPEYVTGQITDPSNGRLVASYSGYVPYATTIGFPWDFHEADGVTLYTNDTYVFTFQASPDAPQIALNGNNGAMPNDAGAGTTLTITNTIGKQGVRTGGGCILNYEAEDPSTTAGNIIDSSQQQWGDTLEFLYESLYDGQFGSLPQYFASDIGPNRSNPSNPHLPFEVNSSSQGNWLNFLQSVITNHAYSDFNYGPGHANGYYIGGGPNSPIFGNYVSTQIGVDQVEPLVVGSTHNDPNWRMRKVVMWGCDTGNKSYTAGYHGWPEAFGIRPTSVQIHSWTKKNVGLFFLDELEYSPYGDSHATICEVAETFDSIWVYGATPFPGGCDPTYSFQFALESTLGMYPELSYAKPLIDGFLYVPYSCVYDNELMINDISHVKTHY